MQFISLYVYLTDIQKHHKAIADNTTICRPPRPTPCGCRYYQQARAGCAIPRYLASSTIASRWWHTPCMTLPTHTNSTIQSTYWLYSIFKQYGCGLCRLYWAGCMMRLISYIYTSDRVWRGELTSMFCATAHLLLPFYHSIVLRTVQHFMREQSLCLCVMGLYVRSCKCVVFFICVQLFIVKVSGMNLI